MKQGTYAVKLDDGSYEFGVLIERSRCIGAYYGRFMNFSEVEFLDHVPQRRGIAVDYATACKCMRAIES